MIDFNLLKHIRREENDSIVVWLFNIGAEKYWNNIEGLVTDKKEDVIVNHVEEMNLLITQKQDYLILRKQPSEEFLSYLRKNNFEIPHIICPEVEDEQKSIAELVLEDEKLLSFLRGVTGENVFFVPYAVSYLEEKIADKCNLKLIGSSSEKCSILNNKIFSKNVSNELGFYTPESFICSNVEETKAAYEQLHKTYKTIIVKTPCNASGKGMWIIDDENKLKTVLLILSRYARGRENPSWIVEGWVTKQKDLNFQVYISEKGDIEVFSIKEQIVEGTVYIGSYVPAALTHELETECVQVGEKIGKYLYNKGYNGIFGVDALVTSDGKLVPIIEINGRFTLSTYISFVEPIKKGKTIYSFYSRKHFCDGFNFVKLTDEIKKNGLDTNEGNGIFVYTSETADSKLSNGMCRLFCIAIGDSREETQMIYDKFEKMCKTFEV